MWGSREEGKALHGASASSPVVRTLSLGLSTPPARGLSGDTVLAQGLTRHHGAVGQAAGPQFTGRTGLSLTAAPAPGAEPARPGTPSDLPRGTVTKRQGTSPGFSVARTGRNRTRRRLTSDESFLRYREQESNTMREEPGRGSGGPQKVPLQHTGCSELKALEILQAPEKLLSRLNHRTI